jgi:hypothetical protein
MNSKEHSRQGWAIGVVSMLAMGGVLILASAAQADQLGGDGGPAAACPNPGFDAGLNIDEIVAQRKVEMAQAYVDRD